jgi:sugar lactone lactonase YvrE
LLSSLSFGRRLAAVSLLSALAAGCSASGTTPSSSENNIGAALGRSSSQNRALANGQGTHTQAARATGGQISPDASKKKKALIYWGSYNTSTITIYSAKGTNGKEEGTITTGLSEPERLFVDAQGSVYATNIGNNTITAYKAGKTSPFLTISNGVDSPTGITVDHAGTVYCANVGNNTITVYPKGQTSPSETISAGAEYLATDANDNLYASTFDGVVKYAPGTSDALEVDRSGNVIYLDGTTIDYFPAGQTQPSKQIVISSGFPFALALTKNEKQLYVSNEVGSGFEIQTVAYPNGSSLTNKLTTNAGQWPISVNPDNALGS